MGGRLPILLPYGLSKEHQSFTGGDTGSPKQSGPLSFYIASLSDLSAPSRSHVQTLPPPASAPHRHRRIEKPKKSALIFNNNDPRIEMARENGKEKHRHQSKKLKPSTSLSTTIENGSIPRRGAKHALNIGADLRLGASHNMPITLDSDSGESGSSGDSDVRMCDAREIIPSPVRPATCVPNVIHSQYRHRNPLGQPRQRSRSLTPPQNIHASSGFSFRSSTPTHALSSPIRSSSSGSETSIIHKATARRRKLPYTTPHATTENEPKNLPNISKRRDVTDQSEPTFTIRNRRPTNMRDGRSSGIFSRTKAQPPGPWQYRHIQNNSENQREFPATSSGIDGETSSLNEKDMTLVDIDDFELRRKVAQLMAVAPALPIRDLYHLVIDSEGRMSTAKKWAMRMSEAPRPSPASNQQTLSRSRTIVERNKGGDDDDENSSEDIKIKIDPSNLDFEWDDDEPTSGSISTLNARPSKSKLRNKPTDFDRSSVSKRLTKRTKTSEIYSRSSAKHSKVPSSKRTNLRETSSDRDFIVADNVVEYALDSEDSEEFDVVCYTPHEKSLLPRRKCSMV